MRGTLPQRVLIVGPSWVGDAVMATPAIRLLRDALPEATIDLLTREPVDAVLGGLSMLDRVRTARPRTLRERKHLARSLREERYDTALLLANGFGTALTAFLAGIPRRVGYARDGRSLMLTDRLRAPVRHGSWWLKPRWAMVSAVDYYLGAASALLGTNGITPPTLATDFSLRLELALTDEDRAEGLRLLAAAGIEPGAAFAVLNPGGNNEAKRWPAERYVKLAEHLGSTHGLAVLVNGSPAERSLTERIAQDSPAVALPPLGGTIPGLKALVAQARLMVTNDTGPRHVAAAFGTPVVTLFGPTDHRWTTIPTKPMADGEDSEIILLADPSLPEDQMANDHPDRCRIERIELAEVIGACEKLLGLKTSP